MCIYIPAVYICLPSSPLGLPATLILTEFIVALDLLDVSGRTLPFWIISEDDVM